MNADRASEREDLHDISASAAKSRNHDDNKYSVPPAAAEAALRDRDRVFSAAIM